MNTLSEIAHSIAGNLNREQDFAFVEKVMFDVNNLRAEWIRQDFTRNRMSINSLKQDLILKTEYFKEDGLCRAGGKSIKRTVIQVPNPIRLKTTFDFDFVGGLDKQTRFGLAAPEELPYLTFNRFKNGPRYSYLNRYIYTANAPGEEITVRDLFEDALEIMRLQNGDCIVEEEMDYPVPMDMIRGISNALLERYGSGIQDNNDEVKLEE